MANPDDYLYEYAVIRYVPHVERGEFMNVGLIMMCKRHRWFHSEIHLNEERLAALDTSVNCKVLQRQLGIFTSERVPFPDSPVEERFRWLTAAKSAILQTSRPHPGIAIPSTPEEPVTRTLHNEFSRLMKEMVR